MRHIHAAQEGGLVPVMLEPGEGVFEAPMTRAQEGALMAVNDAFPRQGGGHAWTVPGYGSGDTVYAWVPSGSFVVNRHAAGALGYQGGGTTGGNGPPPRQGSPRAHDAEPKVTHNHFDLRGVHFSSPRDAKEVIKIIDDWPKKRGNSKL